MNSLGLILEKNSLGSQSVKKLSHLANLQQLNSLSLNLSYNESLSGLILQEINEPESLLDKISLKLEHFQLEICDLKLNTSDLFMIELVKNIQKMISLK